MDSFPLFDTLSSEKIYSYLDVDYFLSVKYCSKHSRYYITIGRTKSDKSYEYFLSIEAAKALLPKLPGLLEEAEKIQTSLAIGLPLVNNPPAPLTSTQVDRKVYYYGLKYNPDYNTVSILLSSRSSVKDKNGQPVDTLREFSLCRSAAKELINRLPAAIRFVEERLYSRPAAVRRGRWSYRQLLRCRHQRNRVWTRHTWTCR